MSARTASPPVRAERPPSASDLRILAFCDYFSPGLGGGAERVAYEVYRRLAAQGAAITVVTTSGVAARWPDDAVSVVRVPTLDLSRVVGLQVSITRGASRRARAVAAAMSPSLLHANSLEFQTSWAAARLRRRSGIPFALTAHIAGFAQMTQPWRTIGAIHQRTVGRSLLRAADRVIAVSDAVARHVRALGYPAAGSRVVPNGVDHAVFRPVDGRRQGPVRVLFVGRLVPNKGAEEAIRAFASVHRGRPGATLEIVGDGPLRSELEGLAARLGAGAAVRFAGSRDDVAARLRDADLLLRPTRTEGMSLTVLEAMASGVCVIASDVPGNRALIDDGRTGALVPVGDDRALGSVLGWLVDHPTERGRAATAALEASQSYSWDRCAAETLEVFLEVARPVDRRRP